jgi:hypothetical protein
MNLQVTRAQDPHTAVGFETTLALVDKPPYRTNEERIKPVQLKKGGAHHLCSTDRSIATEGWPEKARLTKSAHFVGDNGTDFTHA